MTVPEPSLTIQLLEVRLATSLPSARANWTSTGALLSLHIFAPWRG